MRTTITVMLGMCIGVAACVEAESQQPEPSKVPQEPHELKLGLNIEVNEAARLVGYHKAAAGVAVARFEAMRLDEAGAITSSVVRLGDKAFEWSTNRVEQLLTFDGHDAVLSQEDHEAFGALKDELFARLDGDGGASPQLRSLAAHVLWLHSGGVGVSVPRMTVSMAGVQKMDESGETAYGYGRDMIDCARFGKPEYGLQPLCVNDRDRSGTHWAPANIQPCKGSNTNAGCPPTNELWWAFSNGSLACYRSGCGCPGNASTQQCASPGGDRGNWSCQGQCGIGCQGGPHFGRYQDCYEHDVCAFYYGSYRCGPDWWSATTAFFIATDTYGTCDGGKWLSSCPGVN